MTTKPQGPERKRGSGYHKDKKKELDRTGFDEWDHQMADDIAAGKWDDLIDKAHEEWRKWNNIGSPYKPEFKSKYNNDLH